MNNRELPLSVVICALVQDGKILLIKRSKGDYVGFLGLPGGKIEKAEHLSEAACREIFEESGIESRFADHLGFVSEHLVDETGAVTQHFLLHVCRLIPATSVIRNGNEGELGWMDLCALGRRKDTIIPSDFLIMEKMVKNREKNYYNCVIKKQGAIYVLEKFE